VSRICRVRVPQPTPPAAGPLEDDDAPAEPSTRAALGLVAALRASEIILAGSLMARLTPEAMTGLPANRDRSLTPTSVAKMTASAAAMVSADSGVLPDDPCVSTCSVTPASLAAATSESAAM
jgi:hypothetical protein